MASSRKRALESYLAEQTARFDDLQKLSYADRLRVLKNDWTTSFFLQDGNSEKHARAELETGTDTSVQNAVSRVNMANQKPTGEQIDSLIREEGIRSRDKFLRLTESIDALKESISQIEPQALQAFATMQQLNFLRDLKAGTYRMETDMEIIKRNFEAEPEPAAETQTPAESKPETESTKPADAKPESTTETQTQTTSETKSEAPAESKPEVKSETPLEAKPETQTPTEIKPAEVKPETQTPVETKPEVKNETPTEVKTETQTTPPPEIKPEAVAGAVSVNA